MATGTPTPNLGLSTFDTLDDIKYSEINANFQSLDQNLPLFSCTSTTRPTTNLYPNRLIYETDTGKLLRYTNPGWAVVSATKHEDWAARWSDAGGTTLNNGTGTTIAKKMQQGEVVDISLSMIRSATSNVGTSWYGFDLPAPVADLNEFIGNGKVTVGGDAAGARVTYMVYAIPITANVMALQKYSDDARIANSTKSTATGTPGWGANDLITFRCRYRTNQPN